MRNFGHADFGITHRRRVVTIHRAEVTLSVHQHVTHGKILRHANDGVVYRTVAMRVVFTNHVTDDTSRFFIRLVVIVAQLVHGVQDASVHGFQAITRVGQSAAHNHAHRVIEVGTAHFLF